ncbi:hypothetical protein [Alicyclobacillus acidoterrestris]|uniref:Uncharacterized protein n=1 Tax=Alicyclobacillus acidoterrestris (strain ATCC 49025 / DSM 3922 / CIP 106132 / NCIMB 13137 / GD3B) TaxID=1356854 RepID=T0C3W9_ALIAG|nr:hypothetical protein [Alicyclobacillus acidoterrestris]EPZ47699.1 hypothetical protein N007_05445 [Alicyclobacillus acidoterrestris ATCC 49025]UNO47986.1 hypothetical protein K1I37_15030 [Alicyclobacillus acidoterrestris]
MEQVTNRFNAREASRAMGAASVEKVMWGHDEISHVCFTGGTRARMAMIHLHKHDDGTMYGMCPDCKRFVYANPRKMVGKGYKSFDTRTQQQPQRRYAMAQ